MLLLRLFSSRGERGCSLALVCGLLLMAVAPLTAERGLRMSTLCVQRAGSVVAAPRPWSTGSAVVAHGHSCSMACGVFPEQGSNPSPLPWKVASPRSLQGSPVKRPGPSSRRSAPLALGARPVHQQRGPDPLRALSPHRNIAPLKGQLHGFFFACGQAGKAQK